MVRWRGWNCDEVQVVAEGLWRWTSQYEGTVHCMDIGRLCCSLRWVTDCESVGSAVGGAVAGSAMVMDYP